MSSAKEGQEVQKTSCFKHSSQCPLKMRPVLSTGHEIPPGSSSPSCLPPRNPPPRPPWSSAFERLPGSCPRLCPYNGTMLLWGRETMALWDLWILKQQPSKSDYHPTSASGLLSDGRISHVGTHERKQKMFFFFFARMIYHQLFESDQMPAVLKVLKGWRIYLFKELWNFSWWGTSGKGRPKAGATRHRLYIHGWSAWTDPLVSPVWTPWLDLMYPWSHLSSASWHHRRLRPLNPLG